MCELEGEAMLNECRCLKHLSDIEIKEFSLMDPIDSFIIESYYKGNLPQSLLW